MSVVNVKNLNFSYHKGVKVLQDVNFTIERGEFIGMIGPNGGGKTTLLKIMLGLLKVDSGEIEILGKSPNSTPGLIGYVPQYANIDLDYPINVMEVVLMGRLVYKKIGSRYNKEDKILTEEVLKKMNIWELRNKPIGELSGGERQRVLIARAIVHKPKLLLLDEPTNSIDVKGGMDLHDLLRGLDKDMTIVMVSHNFSVISGSIDRVFCINNRLSCNDLVNLSKEEKNKAIHLIHHGDGCPIG